MTRRRQDPLKTKPAKPADIIPIEAASAAGKKPKPVDPTIPPDKCQQCRRTVDADRPVNHALRGSHTCRNAAGVIPPYLDPQTPEEVAAHDAYLARRLSKGP